MDFKKIRIKALSKQALSKLRRGLPTRIMEGEGMQIAVMPHQYSNIERAFMKSKGVNVTLSAPEVDANMVSEISGEGIFGKKADKYMEKKGIKKAIYSVGTALKPLAMASIDAAAAAATAYGVPAPLVALAQNETKGYIDDPDSYQTKKGQNALLKRVGTTALDLGEPYLAEAGIDVQKVKEAGKLAQELKRKGKSSITPETLKVDSEEAFLSLLQKYMDRLETPVAPAAAAVQRVSRAAPPSTNPWDLIDKDGIIGNGMIQNIRKGLRKGVVDGMGIKKGLKKGLRKGIKNTKDMVKQEYDNTKDMVKQEYDDAEEMVRQQYDDASRVVGMGVVQDIRKGLRHGIGGMGLYAGAASGRGLGMGLYAGGMIGESSLLKDIGKRFVNQSRAIIGTGHPGLLSQNLDANFLMSNQMPPAYQRRK